MSKFALSLCCVDLKFEFNVYYSGTAIADIVNIPWAVEANSREEALGKAWEYMNKHYPEKDGRRRSIRVDVFKESP